jgi:indolepyruvate ferredoxin oxidoreductase
LLAKLKKLRGTRLDLFGHTAERRMERALIGEYRELVLSLLGRLDAGNLAVAVEIAASPEKVRGFGHVKEKAVAEYRGRLGLLREKFAASSGLPHAA